MNENKQVQVIVGCLFSTQDVYNVSVLEFVHINNLKEEHNFNLHLRHNSVSITLTLTAQPAPNPPTGQPNQETEYVFQGAEPLDRLRFLGCISYPARHAQPADSDFFSRHRASCRPAARRRHQKLEVRPCTGTKSRFLHHILYIKNRLRGILIYNIRK